MKRKLLALFISLCGFANAQCDAGFTWIHNSANSSITCTANADNPGYFDRWILTDTLTLAGLDINPVSNFNNCTFNIPYGQYYFYITHIISNSGSAICYDTDTIYIDNTQGSICNANYLKRVDFMVPYTRLVGSNAPGLNHLWIYGNDTISTTNICTLNRLVHFSITHVISDNGSCQQAETDTIIASYYNEQECGAWFIYNLTNNPNEFELYSVTGNLYNHIWVIDGDTVGDGDFIFNHLFEWGGPHTVCLTVYNDYCSNTWCDQIIAAGIEDMVSTVSSIYPNPTSGSIFISLLAKQNTDLQLTVYNLLGQPMLNQNSTIDFGNHTIQLQTENLAQGVYILQIANKKTGAVVTKKIVKD